MPFTPPIFRQNLDPPPLKEIRSPNRRYVVELDVYEVRMSHWISTPRVRDAVTGQLILDLSKTMWHADNVQWDAAGNQVILTMRHYPGQQPGIVATIDLPACRCTIQSTTHTVCMNVADAVQWLEMYVSDTK
ncbi:MAG: hypothetical protein JXA21_09705 [Anaerolineae bacterium]|nr:hypothetical protein [Anaerolineae bacterium]